MATIPYCSDSGAADHIRAILGRIWSAEDCQQANVLFHGTGEPLSGPLHVSAADGLFWTAATPAVAQAYIPRAGLTSYLAIDEANLCQRVSPVRGDAISQWALETSGARLEDLDLERDAGGALRSWRVPPGWPTWRDARAHIEELGYQKGRGGLYEVSLSIEGGREIIRPASWKLQGHLVILHVPGLRLRRLGGEGDLTDPQHLWQDRFDHAAADGADGVEIGDFLQSRNWGNVGHRAVGLFPHALEKARYIALPAVNHDFESIRDLSRWETPDFSMIRNLLGAGLDAVPEPAC